MPSSSLRLWYRDKKNDEIAKMAVDRPLWVSSTSSPPSEEHQANAICIHAISSPSGAIGAALAPDELDNIAALNGVPLRAGMHLLRHADQLDLGGRAFWFSTCSTVESTTYDPAVHGDDVFCYLSKARLEPGQAIVVCPAAPGKTCNAIYKESAWKLAMESATMRKCVNCGYRPDESEWKPSQSNLKNKKTIDELLDALTVEST